MAAGLLAGCGGDAAREAAPLPVRLRLVQPAGGGPGGVRYSASIVPRAQGDGAFKVNGRPTSTNGFGVCCAKDGRLVGVY